MRKLILGLLAIITLSACLEDTSTSFYLQSERSDQLQVKISSMLIEGFQGTNITQVNRRRIRQGLNDFTSDTVAAVGPVVLFLKERPAAAFREIARIPHCDVVFDVECTFQIPVEILNDHFVKGVVRISALRQSVEFLETIVQVDIVSPTLQLREIRLVRRVDLSDSDNSGGTDGEADDNCPNIPNPDQSDGDGDGVGDACENNNAGPEGLVCRAGFHEAECVPDGANGAGAGDEPIDDPLDNDGVVFESDNCPGTANPDQTDTDGDGLGDACDQCPTEHTLTNNGGIAGLAAKAANDDIFRQVPPVGCPVNAGKGADGSESSSQGGSESGGCSLSPTDFHAGIFFPISLFLLIIFLTKRRFSI